MSLKSQGKRKIRSRSNRDLYLALVNPFALHCRHALGERVEQVSLSSALTADNSHSEDSFQESPPSTHLQDENEGEQLPMHL